MVDQKCMSKNSTKGSPCEQYPRRIDQVNNLASKTCLRGFIHKGKDQQTSCSALYGEPLLCPTIMHLLIVFLGCLMLPHHQATRKDHGWPWTSALLIARQRRYHITTATLKLKLLIQAVWPACIMLKSDLLKYITSGQKNDPLPIFRGKIGQLVPKGWPGSQGCL